MGATLVLLALVPLVPAEFALAAIVASLFVGGWCVFRLIRDRKEEEEEEILPSPNVILLFSNQNGNSDDLVNCPHCSEAYGLGIDLCPRCHRSARPHLELITQSATEPASIK